MTKLALLLVLVLLVFPAGCGDVGEPSTDDIVNYRGTIIQESAQVFLIESDASSENHLKTFYPLNLPEKYKQDGLRIQFSGKIEIDPTAFYIYPAIRLSRIEQIFSL
jgi:hypothetical protein